MSLDWQAMLDLVLRPISDSEPCGEDPKYNELYEGIREEIAKTSGIGHGACDWEKVLSSSTRLLGQTSKEINIMTYACCSLAQIHGIAGLNAGLKCFSAFCRRSGTTCILRLKNYKSAKEPSHGLMTDFWSCAIPEN